MDEADVVKLWDNGKKPDLALWKHKYHVYF